MQLRAQEDTLPERAEGTDEPAGSWTALRGEALLRHAIQRAFSGRIAVVSSFGAESAVLLAMAAEIDPAVPVLFLDTGKHFPETLEYRDRLAGRLGLTDVRSIGPAADDVERVDPVGLLAGIDPDTCCGLRKVEPLAEALAPFAAWITGRKRHQAGTRAGLGFVEHVDGQTKINPLADWSAERLATEMRRRDLPPHPLLGRGYLSIGCAPCTRAVRPGEDARAGRWAGFAKTECGIHRRPSDASVRDALAGSAPR